VRPASVRDRQWLVWGRRTGALYTNRLWTSNTFFAEGRCGGSITGTFRAANPPRRRGAGGPFLMDMQGFVQTDDGAPIMADYQCYGRLYPAGRRQVAGTVRHLSDDDR
jgi:hypothetical protein